MLIPTGNSEKKHQYILDKTKQDNLFTQLIHTQRLNLHTQRLNLRGHLKTVQLRNTDK